MFWSFKKIKEVVPKYIRAKDLDLHIPNEQFG